MQITAKMALDGVVAGIRDCGLTNSEVIIEMPNGARYTAIITRSSMHKLGITVGKRAFERARANCGN